MAGLPVSLAIVTADYEGLEEDIKCGTKKAAQGDLSLYGAERHLFIGFPPFEENNY